MNIRQLQFFYQTVRTGTFSSAARREGVTVQAVSKSIHELEEELGEPLFIRDGRGMRLTHLGEALLEPVCQTVESFDAVQRAAQEWRGIPSRRDDLRLALITPPFSKHEFICGILSRLMTHSLRIDTRLSVTIGSKALPRLRSGALDAMFTIGTLDEPGCACAQIGSVAPGVFLGRNHPLRRKATVTFADLEPYPVLWTDCVDGFNQTVLVTCRNAGLASPLVSIDTNEEVVDFLENKCGYIMGVNLKALSIRPFAMMHDIDPADAPAVPVCLVTLEGKARPEVERLRRFVLNEFSLLRKLLNAEGTITGY